MAQALALENLSRLDATRRGPSGLALLLRVEDWLDGRRERRAALSLDDRTLADLGLSRIDAERTADGAPPDRPIRRGTSKTRKAPHGAGLFG